MVVWRLLSFWDGLYLGAFALSFREAKCHWAWNTRSNPINSWHKSTVWNKVIYLWGYPLRLREWHDLPAPSKGCQMVAFNGCLASPSLRVFQDGTPTGRCWYEAIHWCCSRFQALDLPGGDLWWQLRWRNGPMGLFCLLFFAKFLGPQTGPMEKWGLVYVYNYMKTHKNPSNIHQM